MKRKFRILLATYGLAAVTALGIYSFAASNLLEDYELAAKYSSARAFEETVSSVDVLREALDKSRYATDKAMMSRLCSESYASALAAETAMSTLPFSNYELEQLGAFLNFTADYAYTLCRQGGESLEEAQLEIMAELSERAGDFASKLRELQSGVNSGELIMDSMQQPLGNVGRAEGGLVSESLRQYESGLEKREIPNYDGKYNAPEKNDSGDLSEDEMKALAAAFAGAEVQQLKEEYRYAGTEGRMCYSAGDTLICVSPAGVESLGQTRLVSEIKLSVQQAEAIAENYLKTMGFEKLKLSESSPQGAVSVMKFAAEENGVIWPDNYIKIAVAMDDGAVYSFNALNYSEVSSGAAWEISEKEARKAVPQSLNVLSSEKLIANSPGGEALGCYRFECTNDMGETVNMLIDGKTAQQVEINVE